MHMWNDNVISQEAISWIMVIKSLLLCPVWEVASDYEQIWTLQQWNSIEFLV